VAAHPRTSICQVTMGSICAYGLFLPGSDAVSFLLIAGVFHGLFSSARALGEIAKAKTSPNTTPPTAIDDPPIKTIMQYAAYALCAWGFWMILKTLSWSNSISGAAVYGAMGMMEFNGIGLYAYWKWSLNKLRCLKEQKHRKALLLMLPLAVELGFLIAFLWAAIFKEKTGG